MNTSNASQLTFAVIGLWASAAWAVNIETVPVGDPGNAADTFGHSGNPAGQGSVAYTYNIGKYEVTAGQYTAFLNAVAATDAYGLYNSSMWSDEAGCKIQRSGAPGHYTYSVAEDRANRPVNFVNWGDAARFSNWLHNGQPTGAQTLATTEDGAYHLNGVSTFWQLALINRKPDWRWAITSEDEWYKAAHYEGGSTNARYYDYPTSSDAAPGLDMADVSGNNANYFRYGNPYPIEPPYYTTVGGEFENSASPYGTFDQGGNVWEWNETVMYDLWDGNPCRGLRGGSLADSDVKMHASFRDYSSRLGITAVQERYYIGFRVVQVPDPATFSLLILGGIGLAARRRWDA